MIVFVYPGGFDDNSPLESVERYDPVTNKWTFVSSMSCPRGGVGVAALGGRIYAVGGHDGSNYLNSVECYDALKDKCVMHESLIYFLTVASVRMYRGYYANFVCT